jgi:hypothetical protein
MTKMARMGGLGCHLFQNFQQKSNGAKLRMKNILLTPTNNNLYLIVIAAAAEGLTLKT